MITFKDEDELAKYVGDKIAEKLQEITTQVSYMSRRKNRPWEDWEDRYLVDNYRNRTGSLMARTLNRTPNSVGVRMCMLRSRYGLPKKNNSNSKCFTFATKT